MATASKWKKGAFIQQCLFFNQLKIHQNAQVEVELVGEEHCTVLFSKRDEDGTGTDLCILLTDLSMEGRQAP